MAHFVGIIHQEGQSDYGVCFPDFPGCITAGESVQEAFEMAQEALRGHIAVMQEYGDALPKKPLTLDQARRHEFAREAAMFFVVEAELPTRPKRVNITMEERLLKQIDAVTPNRSAFLAEAARNYLRQNP